MTFSSIYKNKIILTLFVISWSAIVFWVGLQSPETIAKVFSSAEDEVITAEFYPLDKFVISVPGDDYPHYLLLEMAFKSSSEGVEKTIKKADPLIRNSLMKMFAKKHFNELNNSQQLESLQQEAHLLLTAVLANNQYNIQIDEVLFTRMVIQ